MNETYSISEILDYFEHVFAYWTERSQQPRACWELNNKETNKIGIKLWNENNDYTDDAIKNISDPYLGPCKTLLRKLFRKYS